MANVKKYLEYFIGLNLIVFGVDKFIGFLPIACTLMEGADPTIWKLTGVLEIILGVFLLLRKYSRIILAVVIAFMSYAVFAHLKIGTNDIGGAVFLAVVCLVPFVLKEEGVN